MKNKIFKYEIILIIILSCLFKACTDFDDPNNVTEPTIEFSATPVITSIDPPDSAIAGVREIILFGQNFAVNGKDTNWILIDQQPVLVKSMSADRIVVYRPATFGENIEVKITKPTAGGVSRINNYKIEEPVVQFGDFSYEAYPLTDIEVDNQENLYIATRRKILKQTPDGIDITEVGAYGSDFASITDIKFGPGGYLYVLVGDNELFRIDINTGTEEEYVVIPENTDVFDFDINGNIYAGRRDGIFVINSDKTITATGHYNDNPIIEIRVFNNHVYTASASTLYRNEILDNNGSLGEDQVVVDLNQSSDFESYDISSFNIDANGIIYFCLKGHPQYSIFVLENDGSITPYYKADILPQRVDQIIWGSNRYVYLNRGTQPRDSVRVYRMGMNKNGAPYIGRNN